MCQFLSGKQNAGTREGREETSLYILTDSDSAIPRRMHPVMWIVWAVHVGPTIWIVRTFLRGLQPLTYSNIDPSGLIRLNMAERLTIE